MEVLCSDVIPGAAESFQDHGGSAETFDNWQVGMMKKDLGPVNLLIIFLNLTLDSNLDRV